MRLSIVIFLVTCLANPIPSQYEIPSRPQDEWIQCYRWESDQYWRGIGRIGGSKSTQKRCCCCPKTLVAAMCWSNGFAWKYDTFKKSSFSSWSQPRKPFRSIAHFQTNPYPNMHRESLIYFPAVPMYRRFVADRIAPTLGTAHDGDIVRRVVRIAQTAKEKWRAIGHWPRMRTAAILAVF